MSATDIGIWSLVRVQQVEPTDSKDATRATRHYFGGRTYGAGCAASITKLISPIVTVERMSGGTGLPSR